ncbi:MAG: WD40/YVTN/BNR-like repeat-containing protein, partial [Thermoleophilia bacterium]
DGVLYRTTNGGKSWALSHLNSKWELGAVSFADARHGWVIVHPFWNLGAIARDAKPGWGLLHQLVLLATSDGGSTWTAVESARGLPSPAILTDVECRFVAEAG